MINSPMTPEQVVEGWLPDYEERHKIWRRKFAPFETYSDWCRQLFPEALTELLKAQRMMCSGVYHYKCPINYYVEDLEAEILDADIPEPKNR